MHPTIMNPKIKKVAASWVASLLSPEEGYWFVFSCQGITSLRHFNGNSIMVMVKDEYCVMLKNGKEIKRYEP